jgi:hypothetical protein
MAIPTWTTLCHKDCPKDDIEITGAFLVEAAGYFVAFVVILVVVCAILSKHLKSKNINHDGGER